MKLIRNALVVCALPLLMANSIAPFTRHEKKDIMGTISLSFLDNINSGDYYANWKLTDVGLSKEAFEFAYKGYDYLKKNNRLPNNNVLTIIDYSKPSFEKRLYVIDMNDGRILFHSLAAHGKNSGLVYAGNFSNQSSSLKTSLGFFITGNTYTGENGYSLKLSGCEKGINDKAFQRAIVIHGANYATDYFLQQNGYLGRSHGCPAVPENISKQLINVIKNGSCVFLYHPTKKYITTSKILNSGA